MAQALATTSCTKGMPSASAMGAAPEPVSATRRVACGKRRCNVCSAARTLPAWRAPWRSYDVCSRLCDRASSAQIFVVVEPTSIPTSTADTFPIVHLGCDKARAASKRQKVCPSQYTQQCVGLKPTRKPISCSFDSGLAAGGASPCCVTLCDARGFVEQ